MATCENCGKSFAPPAQPTEVTSARVLCPPCAAKRRAERVERATRASRAAAPAAKAPAPKVSAPAAPAAPAARPAAAASRAAAARAPAEPPKAPSHAAPTQPAPPPRRPRGAAERAMDRSTKIGMIVAGGLIVVAVVVVFVVAGMKEKEADAARALEDSRVALVADLKGIDLSTEEGAQRAIKLAEEKTSLWKGASIAADVTNIVSKARVSLDTIAERKELEVSLGAVEDRLKAPDALAAADIDQDRRKLDEIAPRGPVVGAEFVARIGAARATAERFYVVKVHEEAKAFAAANPGRPALARCLEAEEEVRKLLEKAFREKNKEAEEFRKTHYQELIREGDAVATALFTPEEVAKVAPLDLLAGDQARNWNASEAKGFSFRVENGALEIVGPDPDAGKLAVLSIGDREQWRNFTLEMQFVIEQGRLDVCFRTPQNVAFAGDQYSLVAQGEDTLAPGQKYEATASFIGSRFRFAFASEDAAPFEEDANWTRSRKGAIAFVVPDGTRVKFTRLRLRELR